MPPPDRREGSFDEYRMLIMKSLESLQEELKTVHEDLMTIKVAIAQLQARASIWGALAGLLGGAVISAIIGKLMGK